MCPTVVLIEVKGLSAGKHLQSATTTSRKTFIFRLRGRLGKNTITNSLPSFLFRSPPQASRQIRVWGLLRYRTDPGRCRDMSARRMVRGVERRERGTAFSSSGPYSSSSADSHCCLQFGRQRFLIWTHSRASLPTKCGPGSVAGAVAISSVVPVPVGAIDAAGTIQMVLGEVGPAEGQLSLAL